MEEIEMLYQPNLITQAKYSLSEYETRILVLIIRRIQKELNGESIQVNKDLFGEMDYKIHFELKELMLDESENTHARLKKALSAFRKRDFEIETQSLWFNVGLIQSSTYDKSTHKWTVKISSLLMPYLISMADGFTSYQLDTILRLNPYGQRLYMLMSQWADRGFYKVAATRLHTLLNMGDKYKKYGDFKNWVIIPAMKDIASLFQQANCDLYFTLIDGKREEKDDEWSRTLDFRIVCPTKHRKRNKRIAERYDYAYKYMVNILYKVYSDNKKLVNSLCSFFSQNTMENLIEFSDKLVRIEETAEKEQKDFKEYAPLVMHIAKEDFNYKK